MTEPLETFPLRSSGCRKHPITGVYSITCHVTGKSYIGWSTDVLNRLGWHRSHLRKGKHSRREMQADFIKHGDSTFSFVILAEFSSEEEAVREEARLIGESFKAGTSYNGIVPNATEAKPRAKKREVARKAVAKSSASGDQFDEPLALQESQRTGELAFDVMYYLNFRDDQQLLRCIDSFLKLSGMTEEALSLEVTGFPKFIFALRRPASQGCSLAVSRRFGDYILQFMEERDRLKMKADQAARRTRLQGRKVAA